MKTRTGPIERRKFYQLHAAGKTYKEIAALYGVSAICVRQWCRRQQAGGGVADRYYNPRAGILSQFAMGMRQRIETLKRAHVGWGAESILLHLRKEAAWQGQRLPSPASIGRYLHQFAEFRRPPKKNDTGSDRTPCTPCMSAGKSISNSPSRMAAGSMPS